VHECDIRLFDPSEYAGRVDCIHAGFPCQDISHAGKQAGVGSDTRSGLYREVLRIADVVRPRFIFLENVTAILSNGLDTVLGDLASRGFDCRWTCVRASDVGAPHLRDRWWCLAVMGDSNCERSSDGEHPCSTQRSEAPAPARSVDTCDSDRGGARAWEPDVADSDLARPQGRVGSSLRECAGEWPAREESSRRDAWELEPDVGRVVDGVASRVDRLKALGNGQVPLQAALAWRILTA
jgi:DNA (cytosine-5)-methyltransferase 1